MDAHLQVLDAYILPGTNVQVAPVDSVKDAGAVFSQSSWAVKLEVTPQQIYVDSMLQLEGVQRHSGAEHHTSVRTSIPYALPYVLSYVFPNVLYPTCSPTYYTLRTPLRTIPYVLPYVLPYVFPNVVYPTCSPTYYTLRTPLRTIPYVPCVHTWHVTYIPTHT